MSHLRFGDGTVLRAPIIGVGLQEDAYRRLSVLSAFAAHAGHMKTYSTLQQESWQDALDDLDAAQVIAWAPHNITLDREIALIRRNRSAPIVLLESLYAIAIDPRIVESDLHSRIKRVILFQGDDLYESAVLRDGKYENAVYAGSFPAHHGDPACAAYLEFIRCYIPRPTFRA